MISLKLHTAKRIIWREDVGIEPTDPDSHQDPLDLKSKRHTRNLSPPNIDDYTDYEKRLHRFVS